MLVRSALFLDKKYLFLGFFDSYFVGVVDLDKGIKFSTREWWFLISIMLLIQFIIHWLSYQYGGSSNALGYISFAGTLVSIILGLVAIIYSFVQSISQTSTVVEIREQVERLISAGEDITKSKNDLHASALELSGIADELAKKVSENTNITREFTGRFGNLSEVVDFNLARSSYSTHSIGPDKEPDSEGRSVIYSERVLMTIMSLVISEGAKRKLSLNETQEIILMPFSNKQKYEYSYEFFCGALTALAFSLETEGLVTLSEDDALEVKISVKPEFEAHIEKVASKTLGGDNQYFADFWSTVKNI